MAARMLHGACVGEEAGAREVAAGSTERYLVCAAVAAAIVSLSNRFSLGVLHIWLFNVAHACVVLCVS